MAVLTLWRMGLLGLVRTPWLWGLQALLLLVVPFQLSLRSGSTSADSLELLRAWCYPTGLAGACLAVAGLEARRAFLERVSLRERLLGEWGVGWLAITFLQLPTLVGTLVFERPPGLDLGRSLADILCADLHVAGLALLSLTPPMPANARPLSLLALAWLAPALLAASDAPDALLAPFAAHAPLQDPATALRSLALASGLALAAALGRSSRWLALR